MMSIWTDLWNLFFPHSCLLCGRQLISGERVLCLKCLSGLPRTQFHLRKDNIVECNFWGKIPVEHATSFLYYAKGGNVRQLLYELKYHGNQEVGEVMGRMMASELMCSHFFDGIDLIVPVPLHQRKKRLRGYNQSECLARGVSVVTGIPMDTKVVIRSRLLTHRRIKDNMQDGKTCEICLPVFSLAAWKESIFCWWMMC